MTWWSNRPAWVAKAVLVGATAMILWRYLAMAGWSLGFPLDDGWIHQTYARNLAATGRWEFIPGFVSAGSTSPLWTAWLALGYWLHVPYGLWTHASAGLCLVWCSLIAIQLFQRLFVRESRIAWLPGFLIAGSWSLLWAAGSGMETLLFTALGLSLVAAYSGWSKSGRASVGRVSFMGVLAGLLVLTRPDGVVLLALIMLGFGWRAWSKGGLVSVFWFGFFAMLPVLPYFLFNYRLSGVVWPNTFYAKQAEYADLLRTPIVGRSARLLWFSLGGTESGGLGMSAAHLLLLPGLLVAAWSSVRTDWQRRQFRHSLPLLWGLGHVALYAWRLPVMYQHGRYLLIVLPVWIIFGVGGWQMMLSRLDEIDTGLLAAGWLARRVAVLVVTLVWVVFLVIGGRQYGLDVAFIDGEMVSTAHWLSQETPEDSLIAAHDIGAIGYFAQRPLLDLAGLISPEIIPFLQDPNAMAEYVLDSEASYLVTAPGWPYEEIVHGESLVPLYQTDHAWTRTQGVNNMTVYALPADSLGR